MIVALVVALTAGLVWLHLWRDGGATDPAPASSAPETQATDAVAPTDGSTALEPGPTQVDPTESQTTSEFAQAQAIDGLLDESATTRKAVSAAVQHLQQCRADESDAASFEDGTTVRESLIEQLTAYEVDQLPDGETLRADLELAWQRSADADRSYLAAYRQLQQSCSAGALRRSSDYAEAVSLSDQSTRAKKRFVAEWNPVAEDNALPGRSDTKI